MKYLMLTMITLRVISIIAVSGKKKKSDKELIIINLYLLTIFFIMLFLKIYFKISIILIITTTILTPLLIFQIFSKEIFIKNEKREKIHKYSEKIIEKIDDLFLLIILIIIINKLIS